MTTPTFLWPVPGYYGVSSGFNDVRGYGLHAAIDIPAPIGAPIVAVAGGHVAFAGRAGDCGLAVFIDHFDGWRSHYCHLSRLLSSAGDLPLPQELIGEVGATGAALGPHLHLNLFAPTALPGSRYVAWVNKYAVDPLLYLVRELKEDIMEIVLFKAKGRAAVFALGQDGRKSHVLTGQHRDALLNSGAVRGDRIEEWDATVVDAIPDAAGSTGITR